MYGDLELEDSDADAVKSGEIPRYDGVDGEQKMMSKYRMCEVLGVGSTSVCHRCVDISTGKSYACKVIDKIQIEEQFAGMMDQFHTEIESLKILQHPNIVKLYDVYTTATKIYIVMEFMPGGELFDYIVQQGTLNENQASTIVRMVTSALAYMHDQNIIHRYEYYIYFVIFDFISKIL
jgi:serine/threonine protein kinase